MHVVHCLTHSGFGGGQQVVYQLVRQALRRYPSVSQSVVLPPGGPYVSRFSALGVRVVELPFDSLSAATVLHTRRELFGLQPTVVHSHGKGAGLYARLVPAGGAKRVHSYHGFHPPAKEPRRALYLAVERSLLGRTSAVINVSSSERALVLEEFPSMTGKCITIANVVDAEEVRARAAEPLGTQLASFLREPGAHFLVTMIGRDDHLKNYPLAFAAAESLLERHPAIRFAFVGTSPASAQRLLRQYPDRMIILPSLENTAPLLALSQALMIPSKREGSPLVILEAFALRIPVVGTDVAGIREALRHGQNGLLCAEKGDALAAAVERLFLDREFRDRLAAGAAASAAGTDLDAWVDAYWAVYAKLAGGA